MGKDSKRFYCEVLEGESLMPAATNNGAAKRYEFLQDVAECVALEICKQSDLDEEQAAAVANRLADFLGDRWKGQSIYMPSNSKTVLSARDEEICRRMNRGNANELAAEYGISFVRIYGIYKNYQNSLKAEKPEPKPKPKSTASYSGLQLHNFMSGVIRNE